MSIVDEKHPHAMHDNNIVHNPNPFTQLKIIKNSCTTYCIKKKHYYMYAGNLSVNTSPRLELIENNSNKISRCNDAQIHQGKRLSWF